MGNIAFSGNINELKYSGNTIPSMEDGDIIIVFKGNIYPISTNDDTSDNLKYIINVIRTLCNTYTGMKDVFFEDDGSIKSYLIKDRDGSLTIRRLIDSLYNFCDVPKILFLNVIDSGDGLALSPENYNGSYDLKNSKELQQFNASKFAEQFSCYIIGNEVLSKNDIANNQISRQNVPLSNKLYHGTCLKYALGIIDKGIRSKAENSAFTVNNKGYVFLTTSYQVAYEYATSYSQLTKTWPCVIEVDTSKLNKDNIVLDFDFTNMFTTDYNNSPYEKVKMSSRFKGDIAKSSGQYGTKFSKIGYRGVILPDAIIGVHVDDGRHNTFYNRIQFLEKWEYFSMFCDMYQNRFNRKQKSESKMRVNEWKPDFFNQLPDKIKLYHGTEVMAINDIVESGVICAKNGRKRSETYGVNWFNTELSDNFGHGSNFSIEVPKEDFLNGKFEFMNNSDVTSRDSEIPINKYNFRIEKIGGFTEETFKRIFEKVNGDIFDFVNYLNRVNHEFEEWQFTVDYPVVMYLIRQLFGDEPLRKEGIIESKLYINEVEAEDVSLSSFKTKDELNDKFWINEKLNSRVREKLLDIADDFIDELSIPNLKPKDIVFTGSLANYNWSRYSDIDVHIIVSFKDIYKKVDLIDDYFKSKKEIWNQTHESLKIYGYPVEISVENSDEPGVSSGVYSLIKNKWITEPTNFDDAKLNEKYIKEFAAKVMTDIDKIESRISKETSNSRLEELGEKTMKIFKRLKNMRKEGLARSGEMASGNIIYKLLRRSNYLDKIWDIVNTTYNKINSIK